MPEELSEVIREFIGFIVKQAANLIGVEGVSLLLKKYQMSSLISFGANGEIKVLKEVSEEKARELNLILMKSIIDDFGLELAQNILLNSYQKVREKYAEKYPVRELLNLAVPSLLEISK